MADFDPDAFLADKPSGGFDPDAFLAGPFTAAPQPVDNDVNRIDLNAPAPDPQQAYRQKILDDYRAQNETNADFMLGAVRGATLGAAPAISRRSAVVQGFSPHGADAIWKKARERSPLASAAGEMVGSIPAALATGGTSALGQALGGLGLSTVMGFLGSDVGSGAHDTAGEWSPDNIEGKAYDAASQGMLAAPLAIGLSAGPKVANATLGATSKALGLPRKGIDLAARGANALREMMGGKPAFTPKEVPPMPVDLPTPVDKTIPGVPMPAAEGVPHGLDPVYDAAQFTGPEEVTKSVVNAAPPKPKVAEAATKPGWGKGGIPDQLPSGELKPPTKPTKGPFVDVGEPKGPGPMELDWWPNENAGKDPRRHLRWEAVETPEEQAAVWEKFADDSMGLGEANARWKLGEDSRVRPNAPQQEAPPLGPAPAKAGYFQTNKEAWDRIVSASGVDDTAEDVARNTHGQYDEIERILGRKVQSAKDAFDGLVRMSAAKNGRTKQPFAWEDVNTAIGELRKIEGFERLNVPSEVQEALTPGNASKVAQLSEPSFNFGANAKPELPSGPVLPDGWILGKSGANAFKPVDEKTFGKISREVNAQGAKKEIPLDMFDRAIAAGKSVEEARAAAKAVRAQNQAAREANDAANVAARNARNAETWNTEAQNASGERAAKIAQGKQTISSGIGVLGGIKGLLAGGRYGGSAGLGGAAAGQWAAKRAFRNLDKGATKLDELGVKLQSMLTDKSKLQQLAGRPDDIGRAAQFVIGDGNEASFAARALIVSQAPWFRQLFDESDESR